jgi:NAD kinase
MAGATPRVVVVTRQTEYAALLARHGTREQARFFLATRGRTLESLEAIDSDFRKAMVAVSAAIPVEWRRARVDRGDLDRFLFEPEDLVVAVGQDGLVANVAKYLTGQPVIGCNPDPSRNEGALVRHTPAAAARVIPLVPAAAAAGDLPIEERTMVRATLDDGVGLLALNEIFAGHQSHQSARYRLSAEDREERQSSSGIVVTTGTGASGWGRSISLERHSRLVMPRPDERALAYFVREAWPSVATGATLTEGRIADGAALAISSEMNDGGVVFGDGIESDRLEFGWGRRLEVRIADERLHLVTE